MTNQPKCIAFYLRSATGNLADLRRQRKLCEREFVNKKVGFTSNKVEIYQDTHQSGLRSGPDFKRLSDDVESGKVAVVIVARINRISRRLDGLMKFYRFVEAHHLRFVSAEENVDSSLWPSMRQAEVAGGVR